MAERLASLMAGRSWIIAYDVSAAATDTVDALRSWGADIACIVAANEGAGEQPSGVATHHTRSGADSIVGGIRAYFASIERPTDELAAFVEACDPDGSAMVLAPPFATIGECFGRHVYGGRRDEWIALEDKTLADALWDAADVPRAPSSVVPVRDACAAAKGLASPQGTVWVADNHEGWHGGGDYVRWVRDDAEAIRASTWFEQHATRVRVMPFLEGIPCSIHGFVTGTGVATFRPVEMLVLRRADASGFVYAGAATTWDPPESIRKAMRAAAGRVGTYLAATVGYLGPYSIDGVCTLDGFLPTELNPRMSAGFGAQLAGLDHPLEMMTRAVVEGELELDAAWLERVVVAWADANRLAGMGLPVSKVVPSRSVWVRFAEDRAFVTDEESAHASIHVGPGPSGSYVRMRVLPGHIESGSSSAPRAVAAAALANELWSLAMPPLAAAPDVCAETASESSE